MAHRSAPLQRSARSALSRASRFTFAVVAATAPLYRFEQYTWSVRPGSKTVVQPGRAHSRGARAAARSLRVISQ